MNRVKYGWMTGSRALRVAVAAFGAGALLAGCTGGAPSAPSAPSTDVVSPSAAPSAPPSGAITPATMLPRYDPFGFVTEKSSVTARFWQGGEHVLAFEKGRFNTQVVLSQGIVALATDSSGNQSLTVTGVDAAEGAGVTVAVIDGAGFRQGVEGWARDGGARNLIEATLPLISVVDERFLQAKQEGGDVVFTLKPGVEAFLDGEPVSGFERVCASRLMSDAVDRAACVLTVDGVLLQEIYWQPYEGILTAPVSVPVSAILPGSFPDVDGMLGVDGVGEVLASALPDELAVAESFGVAVATIADASVRTSGGMRAVDVSVVAGEAYMTVSAMAIAKDQFESMLLGYRSGGADVSVSGETVTVVFPGDAEAGTVDAVSVYRAQGGVLFVVAGNVSGAQALRMLDLLA